MGASLYLSLGTLSPFATYLYVLQDVYNGMWKLTPKTKLFQSASKNAWKSHLNG